MKIMVSAARSARRVIITVAAVLVMGSMLVGALASLTRAVSAGAASNALTITPSSLTVNGSQTGMASVNATGSSSLSLSFSYDASKLEPGDSLTYGWRNGTTGVDNKLGQIDGQTNTSGQPGVNEVGSKTVSLPDTAQTADLVLYFTNSGQNGISDSITISSLALSGSQVDTNNNNQPVDYANVYVSKGGDDQNDGVSADKPFATIQHALDTVAANGTVHVANGTYGGTMQFKKSGVTLIGDSKASVVLQPESSDGQAGVYATGVNNVTLQNATVNPGASLTAGSLVKFTGGTGGNITNVDVKSTTDNHLTGIDINSFANVSLNNVYVNGVGKDGISVTANFQGTSQHTSNNISFNSVSVAHAAWSGIAFYTTASNNVTPTSNISGITFNDVSTQYNARGIYLEGISGKTITGANGAPLDLGNIKLADSTQAYIANAQTADVLATGAQFNVGQGIYKGVNDLTADQWATVKNLIVDQTHNNGGNILGAVKFYNLIAPTNLAPADGIYTNDPNFADTWDATAPSDGGYDYQTANSLNSHNTLGQVIYRDNSFNDNNYSTANGTVKRLNSGTPEGVYYWQVRTVAPDGEKSDWSTPQQVTVDRTAPTLNLSGVTDGQVLRGTVNLNASVTDDNQSVLYLALFKPGHEGYDATKVFVNTNIGQSNYTGVWNTNTTDAPDGTYTLRLEAKDLAGNDSKKDVKVVVDNTKPVHPTNLLVNGQSGTFYAKVGGSFHQTWSESAKSKDVIGYNYESCYVNQAPSGNTCPGSKYTANKISANSKTVNKGDTKQEEVFFWHVQAFDAAGNVSGWSKWSEVVVDSTAPIVTINALSAVTTARPTIRGTIDDSSAKLAVYVDGKLTDDAAKIDGNTWTWMPASPLLSGDHSVAVIATDAAGNVSSSDVPTSGDAYQTFNVASDVQSNTSGSASSSSSTSGTSNGTGSPSPQQTVVSLFRTFTAPVATIARALTPAIVAGTIAAGTTPTTSTPGSTVATTDPNQATQDNQGSVLGAQTTKPNSENNSTRSVKTNNGLAWYWWWVIVAAAIAAAWWIIAAVRRRRQQAEDDITA